LISILLNSIYTATCISCDLLFEFSWQNCFCSSCIDSIKKENNLIYCRSCGNGVYNCQRCLNKRYFKDIQVFCSYKGVVKDLIYEYKLNGKKRLSKILAEKIKDDFTRFIKEKNIDMVAYVPVHKSVEKERGFNHLREILNNIIPSYMIFDGIKKIKNTKLQTQLTKKEREKNLKDAFTLDKLPKAENIVIFDDVLTTGSTIMEIYKTLRKAKYNGNIYGYIITKS